MPFKEKKKETWLLKIPLNNPGLIPQSKPGQHLKVSADHGSHLGMSEAQRDLKVCYNIGGNWPHLYRLKELSLKIVQETRPLSFSSYLFLDSDITHKTIFTHSANTDNLLRPVLFPRSPFV